MDQSLASKISQLSQQKNRPDTTAYSCLLHEDEQKLARETGLSARQIQITALSQDIIPERYCRNQKTLNNDDQIALLESHVAIIGQGGLGGAVTEILARIGVGSLTLVDGDVFEESNLNRQLLSTVDALGKDKALVGKERVEAINPAVHVNAVTNYLTRENCDSILADASVAVDCLDSIPARFILAEGSKKKNIPLVSAAIAGETGQALVLFPGDPGFQVIYGSAETAPPKGAETRLGTLPHTAIFMAAIECAEVVSLLLRKTAPLQGKLLMANINEKQFEKIHLS